MVTCIHTIIMQYLPVVAVLLLVLQRQLAESYPHIEAPIFESIAAHVSACAGFS